MGQDETCRLGGSRKPNGNCPHPDPVDGLAVQSVGAWTDDKHAQLSQYLAATREVRRKFVEGSGGAAFIDLFSGPGRVHVRERDSTQLGSGLIAAAHHEAPFTRLLLCELDPENADALRRRTKDDQRVTVFEGDCNELIDEIVAAIPPNGLNIALIDPFGTRPLRWTTIARLATVKRMDLLIHFPTNAIKRNFLNPSQPHFDEVIDAMVGTSSWRDRVQSHDDVVKLIDVLREQLATVGYDEKSVRSPPITNNQHGVLYHLMFVSKSQLGTKIWESISRHSGAQRGFGF